MSLFNLFETSVKKYGGRTALFVEGVRYSYNELSKKAKQIAYLLDKCEGQQIGVFAARSLPAYAGLLGTLAAGKTYVALNKKFSDSRNQLIIKLANIQTLVVDQDGLNQIQNMKENLNPETVLIAPHLHKKDIPEELKGKFKIYTRGQLNQSIRRATDVPASHIAYIIFTSGSTGIPKGVPVSHGNVLSYISYVNERYDVGPEDRFSQVSDLTFDASVHDMFLSWRVGASLYSIPAEILMAPAKFIKQHKLTTWFSIPSLVQFMKKFKMLKPGVFPDIRYSLFGGEALPKSLALAWQKAAPNSIVENQYGASEITVGLSHYRIPKDANKILHHNGIVSVGTIFNTQDFCLINEENEKVEDEGELCLTGPQITTGYWENPDETAKHYFKFPGDERLWYKTGDILKCKGENLFYISRKDFMVKVRGFRIELEEINLAIKDFTKCERAYTLPYPVNDGLADNLYSFIEGGCNDSKTDIMTHLREKLTTYMVPKDIICVKELPLNVNGKIDREQLIDKIKKVEAY